MRTKTFALFRRFTFQCWTSAKHRYDPRVPRPVDIVIDFLREQESRGMNYITLDEEARNFLNHLAKQKSPTKAAAPSPATSNTPAPRAIPVKETPAAPVAQPAPTLQISGNSKAERLADLKRQLATWPARCSLTTLRPTLVFSSGNPDAAIMLVGESPTHADEAAGFPFSGAAGEKFDAILKAMKLSRAEVYMTYLVKYRPSMPRQTTNNRTPNPAEIAAFLPALQREVDIIQPKVILTLGSVASLALCQQTASPESLRGQWHEWQGIPLRTSESPSLLLTASIPKKREVWEDMLAVMEALKMPIDDKQRGYFTK